MDNAHSGAKSAELSIQVIRADGTKEDLGVVAKYFDNPLKQAAWDAKQKLKQLVSAVTKTKS